jgi:hypothetical protein
MDVLESQTHDYGLDLVRELKIPPQGFRASSASERELHVYRLPLRPDAEKHAKQAALWDDFAARPLRFVRAPLVPLQERVRSEIHDFRKHTVTADNPALRESLLHRLGIIGIHECWIVPLTSSNWSGMVVTRPTSEPLKTVTGQWVVPSVSPPQSAWNGTGYNDGTYICAVWVGLDGWNGSNDVLQAGTNSVVTVSGGVVTSRSSYAWIEWYGNPWQVESTFPVSPGDAILCTVCTPSDDAHGIALFVNQTTGLAANYPIEPPASVSLIGNVAEWTSRTRLSCPACSTPSPTTGSRPSGTAAPGRRTSAST